MHLYLHLYLYLYLYPSTATSDIQEHYRRHHHNDCSYHFARSTKAQEVSTIPSPPGLRSATQKKLPSPQSQWLLSHCLFMSPGGNVQCAIKLGSAVLPWTPCRVHVILGNTGNCVLETRMAPPRAATSSVVRLRFFAGG